jgi:hypothetical protein
VGTSVAREATVLSRSVGNTTHVLSCTNNIHYTSSNGFLGKGGWELYNTSYQNVRNIPSRLNKHNYTGHAIDQMQNRGIMPSVVENTINYGSIYPTRPGTLGYFDPMNKVRVIMDTNTQNIITVIRGGYN